MLHRPRGDAPTPFQCLESAQGSIWPPRSMRLSFCWKWRAGDRPRSARTRPPSQQHVPFLHAKVKAAVVVHRRDPHKGNVLIAPNNATRTCGVRRNSSKKALKTPG